MQERHDDIASLPRMRSRVRIAQLSNQPPSFDIRPMTERHELEELLRLRWSGGGVFVRGRMVRPHEVEAVGAYLDDRLHGVATWRVEDGVLYMLTVNNITDQRGVASALLDRMIAMAREQGFATLRAVISNDNWPALRFYQKRGFRIVELHVGIVDRMRVEMPSIPERGVEGIAMRDEIELEIAL
jgi:GNAT superfamily N-acetyltransferase